MQNTLRLSLIFGLVGLAFSVWGGEAFDEKIKCPVGGKRVEIVGTFSCSTSSSVTMSLRRPSSCDFVTRLPICHREAFPVYREFSSEEVKRLKQILKTDWYQNSKSQSRYLRAYLVEKELGSYSEKDLFWLLQGGHYYDPKQTFGNKEFFAAFRDAANAFVKIADDDDKKLVLLLAAFARVHSAEPQKASVMLKSAKQYKTPNIPFFDQYMKLVGSCVDRPNSDACSPEHQFKIE